MADSLPWSGLRIESWSDGGSGAAAIWVASGFEPKRTAAACITIRPLRMLILIALPTAWGRVCH